MCSQPQEHTWSRCLITTSSHVVEPAELSFPRLPSFRTPPAHTTISAFLHFCLSHFLFTYNLGCSVHLTLRISPANHDSRQTSRCLRLVSDYPSPASDRHAPRMSTSPTPPNPRFTPGTQGEYFHSGCTNTFFNSCGSTGGKDPVHLEAARTLAHEFHKNNVQLVYGGGTTGLMGEVAKTLVSLSGPKAVHGVIPKALIKVSSKESNGNGKGLQPESAGGKAAERVVSESIDEEHVIPESEYGITTIVPDMHTRKRLMATKVLEGGRGSGFVSLAGGFGTIEEVMEMTTWNQLGIHRVGVVLLNINGYWDGLLSWVRNAVKEGFISGENGSILAEARDAKDVWPKLLEYKCSVDRMHLDWAES